MVAGLHAVGGSLVAGAVVGRGRGGLRELVHGRAVLVKLVLEQEVHAVLLGGTQPEHPADAHKQEDVEDLAQQRVHPAERHKEQDDGHHKLSYDIRHDDEPETPASKNSKQHKYIKKAEMLKR